MTASTVRREGDRALSIADSELGSSQDAQDGLLPLTDRHSGAEHAAARAVAAGGGMQAVIEASGLRTSENVLRLIDPAILARARQHDAARLPAPSPSRARSRSRQATRVWVCR